MARSIEPKIDPTDWEGMAPNSPSNLGWQTIETAPKDGTHLYAHMPARGETHFTEPAWETQAFWSEQRGCWLGADSMGLRVVQPTLWCALPDPPTSPL